MAGFLLGSAGMFATMYSTQAILPDIGRTFDVGPAGTGLTISAVVAAVAAGVWLWGPLSDRIGRRRSIVVASALLVVPTIAAGLAPTFGLLLACRAAQGLCMPGLLAVGVPYVMEAFGPWLGGRAMGVYVSALVVGGLIGRLGIAFLAAVVGWRWAVGGLAVLPAAAAVVMHRSLPDVGPPARSGSRGGGVPAQLRNGLLLRIGVAGGALFFTFVGVFSYAVFRLRHAPFNLGGTASALIFVFWLLGAVGPFAGKYAERVGWRRVAFAAVACCLAGVALTIPPFLPTFALGLASGDPRDVQRRDGAATRHHGCGRRRPRRGERRLLQPLLRRGCRRRLRAGAGLAGVALGRRRRGRPGRGEPRRCLSAQFQGYGECETACVTPRS